MTKGEKKDESVRTEEKYKALVETAGDAIYTLDLLGRFTFVNPAGERISGYTKEELVGKHFRELLPLEYLPVCLNVFQKAIRGKETPPIEIEMITKEGERVPLELLGRPVKRGRRIVEILGIGRDITERKRAEEALRESEEKYRNLVERATDGITIIQDTIVKYVNPRLAEMWGGSVQEVIGTLFTDYIYPDELPKVVERYKRRMAGEDVAPIYETVLRHKDGSKVYAELNAGVITYQGKPANLVIARDITGRKRAEEALRKSEERYKKQFEEAMDAIFIADAETGILVDCNRVALELVGREKSELVGKHQRILHPPEEIEGELSRTFKQHLKEKEGQVLETKVITKRGEIKDVAIKASIFELEGQKVLLGIFRDITERKRAEEALRESEEKYRTILENIEDGYFEVDIAGNLTFFNDSLCRINGYSREEMMGMNNRQYMDDETAKAVYQTFNAVYRTGKPAKIFGYEIIQKDGTRRSVETSVSLISGSRGEPAGFRGTVRDITERKQAEEDIRRRSEQLAALNTIAQTVSRSLDLDTVLSAALDKVLETLQFESGAIYMKDIQTGELEMKHHRGLSEEFQHAVAKGIISARVAESGNPMITDDLCKQPNAPTVVVEEGYRPLASIPLRSKQQIQGVLTVTSRQLHHFRQLDVDLLLSIGNQIGVAIENARLYEKEQRRVEELFNLNKASQVVASSLDIQDVLTKIVSLAGEVANSAYTSVVLVDEDGGLSTSVEDFKGITSLHLRARPRGVTRRIINTAEAVIVDQVLDDGTHNPALVDAGIKSYAGVPIMIKGKILGVLFVHSLNPYAFSDRIPLLTTFATQAAIAIENARLYEEEQKRLAETTALHRVSEVINSTLDLQEIFQRVVEELSQTFGYRLVDIYLLEEEGLRLQAQVGYDSETTIDFIPLERGVVGRVARTGQPAFIQDVHQEPDYISAYPDIENEICVPIMRGDTFLGTLNVESDDKRPLTEDDLQLLVTLSSHIGVAIENARLFEEEQRLSTQRRTIAEVGRKVAAILEMDTLLPQVVDLIAQGFGYYHVHIFQVDQDSGYALYKAGTGKADLAIAEEGLRLKVGEEGIIGWVAQSGQPLIANDVNKEPRYYFHPAHPDTRSELAVPISVGGKVIGILDVQSTELDAFDESDLDTLQTLADQLAVAMENARLYQETKRLSITDGLTGLYNLRYFYGTLEKEIQRSERYHRSVSLIILDIDDFKAYNDLYGHPAGDDLLKELAQVMSRVTRQTDTLARYGGEEFVVIQPETETEGAKLLAERLQEEVREHRFSIQDGQTIGQITISLGVATYPHHADSAKTLVDAADRALLRAKRAGKNRLSVSGEN